MNGKMTPFQIIILAVFGFFIIAGVIFFATYASESKQHTIGKVVIWGTLPSSAFLSVFSSVSNADPRFANVSYVQKDPATFESDLSDALAAGTGPSLFLLSQDEILAEQDKILTIPYSSLPQKTFTDTYIDEAQLYLTPKGALALPLVVDPMVLYWNKDMLAKEGFAQPPQYWDDVVSMAEKMGVVDSSGTITQGAIALGESSNVLNAKDIMSMLIMQAGGAIVSRTQSGGLASTLAHSIPNATESPAISALRFYTNFANPTETLYSWNRALPDSQHAFAEGTVGLYLGFASENATISALNPNLNYDIAPMPQIRGAAKNVTEGEMYALAIPRTAPNAADAATIASAMAAPQMASLLSDALKLPAVRRDLLAQPTDGAMMVFRAMALISQGWLDPAPSKTDALFASMISGVTSGSARLTDAASRAEQSIEVLLPQ